MGRRKKELSDKGRTRLRDYFSLKWRFLNDTHFGGRLIEPLIELDAAPEARLCFEPVFHDNPIGILSIPEQLVLTRPLGEVVEVFRDATAQQYVHAGRRTRRWLLGSTSAGRSRSGPRARARSSTRWRAPCRCPSMGLVRPPAG